MKQCDRVPRIAAFATSLLLAFVLPSNVTAQTASEDVVILSSSTQSRARMKITGRIVDYTGREIVIELAGGATKKAPGEQVVDIQSTWTVEQTAADALFVQRQFAAALAKYGDALRKEERKWARRKIMAQLVVCLREVGQTAQAGDFFLALMQSDPSTPYFPVIPLAWIPGEPAPALEAKAKGWLARDDSPVALLLGASHLLSTSQAPLALQKLERASASDDARVAILAEAQLWRGTLATATPDKLQEWTERIERCPESLAAGPYLALGRALDYGKRPDDALLALLRVSILYPQETLLAPESLMSAGRIFEKLGRTDDAARVYRELLTSYPQARTASEARTRLETELKPGP